MKLLPGLLCVFVLLATATGVFAASSPPAAPASLPAPPAISPPPVSQFKFDYYMDALTAALKLSDDEKKAITSFYQGDDKQLQAILSSDSISPLEQDRQVSDLRAARNAKVDALLGSSDRMAAFLKIEARYRVALIELAANSGPALSVPSIPAATAQPAPPPKPGAAPAPTAPVPSRTPPPE
jgi:hypothetical protein